MSLKVKRIGSAVAALLLSVVLAFALIGCSDSHEEPEGGATVTLSAQTLELDVLEKSTLTASAEGTEEAITWSSSDPSVAEVNGGEVFALQAGNTTITASAGGAQAACVVTVYDSGEYPSMRLDKSTVNIKQGNKVSVSPSMEYKGESIDAAYSYTTENSAVATFENGIITGIGIGSTVVSVTGVYGNASITREVSVTVSEDVSFMLDQNFVELATSEPTEEYKSSVIITPSVYEGDIPVEDPVIEWETDSPAISVESGLITANARTDQPATVTATYRSNSGNDYVCKVQVNVILPEVTSTFTATAELNADGAGEMIPFDFSSSTLDVSDLVSVTDINHDADIDFTVSGNTVNLAKSDLYSGINEYAFEMTDAIYRLTLKTVTRYLRTITDLTRMEEYSRTDKDTVEATFTLNNEVAEGYRYGGYFELVDDIDCGGAVLPDWCGKTQYGNNGAAENSDYFGFQGTFEGNGHTIRNFAVDGGDRYFSGLFGTIGAAGVVRNLGLEAAGVGYCGGALAGILGGTVENVSISGSFNRQNFAANWMYSGLCAARVTSTANVRNLFVNVTSTENTGLNTASVFGTIDSGAVFENVIGVGLEDGYVTGQRYGQPNLHSGAGITAYETLSAMEDVVFVGWDDIWDISGDYPVLVPVN